MRVSREEFETLVEEALEGLPGQFAELLDNVVVMVEDEPTDEDLRSVGIDPEVEEGDLFGLYHGVPLPDRGHGYGALPDRIAVFREPILRYCQSRREVIREVRQTVMHELGHYFGMEEEDMPY